MKGLALLAWLLCPAIAAGPYARAQAAVPVAAATTAVLDRVVADVDGQAILASDVDDEMRFSALQPGLEPPEDNTPQRALNRVIDRALIDQQRALQPGVAVVSQKDVDEAVAEMRKQISATTKTDCETDAGWKAFLARHGFTPEEVEDRMRERLAILKFIDVRFGVAAQVSNAAVRTYYAQVLTPELEKDKVPVPELRAVAPRIREVLRQQQVSNMIDEWLKGLRAEGHVQILDSAYAEARGNGSGNKEGGQ
ncbi:MAG: SurA N-terminal domain-containing protein [Acidobacteriaceae bacterium]